MKELLAGETYNRSYLAVPIIRGPLFEWARDINGHKKFYHVTLFFLGKINYQELDNVKNIMQSIPQPKNKNGLPLVPESLGFLGKDKRVFAVKLKKNEELDEIREIFEINFPQSKKYNKPFAPHITIETSRGREFESRDILRLLKIKDKSKNLDTYFVNSVGLYYKTEEGATALLFSKKL